MGAGTAQQKQPTWNDVLEPSWSEMIRDCFCCIWNRTAVENDCCFDKPRSRGRSRTPRMNVNASFDERSAASKTSSAKIRKNASFSSQSTEPIFEAGSFRLDDECSRYSEPKLVLQITDMKPAPKVKITHNVVSKKKKKSKGTNVKPENVPNRVKVKSLPLERKKSDSPKAKKGSEISSKTVGKLEKEPKASLTESSANSEKEYQTTLKESSGSSEMEEGKQGKKSKRTDVAKSEQTNGKPDYEDDSSQTQSWKSRFLGSRRPSKTNV